MSKKIKIGITIGDFNGIGIEVIIKTFMDSRMLDSYVPVIYGSPKVIAHHKKILNFNEFNYNIIKDANDASSQKINVVTCWDEEVPLDLGKSTPVAGKYAFRSLEAATHDIASNKIDVLVTAPINKHNIQSDEFNFPGHTEYLANYANEDTPLMIMVAENLRVGLVTGHVPVKNISSVLTTEKILEKVKVFNKSLIQDFGIVRPKIALLGLNPHAGDNGLLGEEEKEIIEPAIHKARERDILAFGPYPADGFFGSSSLHNFDGVLAMYHDQGLTPFKALSFDTGVNFTAGLPIVRTAPDHGTGYDIAGKNVASENSFRQAVYLAGDIHSRKKAYRQMTANPLMLAGALQEGE